MKNTPHNTEAEKAVLGAMIENKNIRVEALGLLKEEDFYEQNRNNKYVFTAISRLVDKGHEVDITSITEELLNGMKVLNECGGVEYLNELCDLFLGEKNALHHINIVRDLALLRRFFVTMENVTRNYNQSEVDDIPNFIANSEKELLDVTKARRSGTFQTAEEVVDKVSEGLKIKRKKYSKYSFLTGVDTGFSNLNRMTLGLQKGDLVILAARPSVGKTALAINIAFNAAVKGNRVAFFSLEMTAESIVTRMLASKAMVDLKNVLTGNLSDADWTSLSEAFQTVKDSKLMIDDTSAARLNDIKTKAMKLKAQHDDLGLIVIDYLGLITTDNSKVDNRQLEVGEISRSLKQLARELKIPVLVLCQLSRASEKRADRTPMLSDLRDSGSIEQDADQVYFIHRPLYQNPAAKAKYIQENGDFDETVEPTTVIIAKNRNGQTGNVEFHFAMNFQKFIEIDKKEK